MHLSTGSYVASADVTDATVHAYMCTQAAPPNAGASPLPAAGQDCTQLLLSRVALGRDLPVSCPAEWLHRETWACALHIGCIILARMGFLSWETHS